MKKIIGLVLVLFVGGFVLMQLVPYGRNHNNPPVVSEPNWDSPETRALAVRACYDCHSNETKWPWYTNVAPVSWLIQREVDEGREELNFSTWGQSGEGEEGEELSEAIYEGGMPPAQYLLLHPTARLTDAEKQALARGLTAIGGTEGGENGEREGNESEGRDDDDDGHEENEREEEDDD